MHKKGMEMTFNTIVVAAIAIIVLVVVILIFTGAMKGSWADLIKISSCEGKGGHCIDKPIDGEQCILSFAGCGTKDKTDNQKYCCFKQ